MKFIKPLISIAIAIMLSFFSTGVVYAQPAPTMASLVEFAGTAPKDLGLKAGTLKPCPSTPNCVVSQGGDGEHTIEPLTYQAIAKKSKQF